MKRFGHIGWEALWSRKVSGWNGDGALELAWNIHGKFFREPLTHDVLETEP